ncbi:MAG: biotin/lipoyl-containing protein, partial [Pseudomonadota bacterium]
MSDYIFKLPDLGEGTVEAEIGEWHIKVGDNVREEDVVGAMMTDKAAGLGAGSLSGTAAAVVVAGPVAAALAPSVSKITSGAPTATMSPGSPASDLTVPLTGDDTST